LKAAAAAAGRDGRLGHALNDFLDGFYSDPDPGRLADEPAWLEDALGDGGLADAYLAAVCDHLCRQNHFPRPAWVKSPGRVLKTPFFAARSHGLRMIHLQESPTAFRQRNLFVSANALSRA
jgi:hypothetical protein